MSDTQKTAIISLHFNVPDKLNVSYKNKNDLWKSYKKWIRSLNLPSNEVYFCDREGYHTGIRNADDLFEAVQQPGYVKLFTPGKEREISTDSESEIASSSLILRGRSQKKKWTTNSRLPEWTPTSSPPPYYFFIDDNCTKKSMNYFHKQDDPPKFRQKFPAIDCSSSYLLSPNFADFQGNNSIPTAQISPWKRQNSLRNVHDVIDAVLVVARIGAKAMRKLSIIASCWGLLFMLTAHTRHCLKR
ncbi:unnamed protein product [Cylicostephanus goldi]|uniref:Uncharacterized protein n=1 Tax=Cylicostephanus goldi TaxID=71465 RepID=A0A3P6RZ73_CYLGO|nr:unnamed protein product [Cylicostephanus goldi]